MKKLLAIALSMMVCLGFASVAFADNSNSVTFPNPLCLTGSEGTCDPGCDGGVWQATNGGEGYPFSSFSACCAAHNATITGGTGTCINDFPSLISTISQYILGIIGILATLMFLIAGILFVVSHGDPGKITTAKHAAIYAAIGVAIAVAGEGFIKVIQAVFNVS